MFHIIITLSHQVATFYRWCTVGYDIIKALKYIYNEARKIYLHLDNGPIIFGEIETSYFNIELSIILHEIEIYFNYSS